jgi:hypothetical protein
VVQQSDVTSPFARWLPGLWMLVAFPLRPDAHATAASAVRFTTELALLSRRSLDIKDPHETQIADTFKTSHGTNDGATNQAEWLHQGEFRRSVAAWFADMQLTDDNTYISQRGKVLLQFPNAEPTPPAAKRGAAATTAAAGKPPAAPSGRRSSRGGTSRKRQPPAQPDLPLPIDPIDGSLGIAIGGAPPLTQKQLEQQEEQRRLHAQLQAQLEEQQKQIAQLKKRSAAQGDIRGSGGESSSVRRRKHQRQRRALLGKEHAARQQHGRLRRRRHERDS